MKRRVTGLLRVSAEEQAAADKVGIARQQAAVERVCRVHGLDCVRMVELVDVFGTSVRHCLEIQEIIEDVRTDAVDGIAVAALDRLARTDGFEGFEVFQAFQDAKAVIFAADGVLDFGAVNTFMLTALKGAIVGTQNATLRARMEAGKEGMRKQGRHAGSALTLPRGVAYDRTAHTWSYTPEVAAIVEAFRLVDEEGISNFSELSRRVALKATGLRVTLRNPIYTGWRVIDSKRGGPKRVGPDGRQAARGKVKRAPEEVIRVQVISEPAVALDRFERVQAILDGVGHRRREIRARASNKRNAGTKL
jgi:DNA invertase Pin-like site-specific DNA recombinase